MKPPIGAGRRRAATLLAAAVGFTLMGCTGTPLVPFSTDTPPLVLVPAAQAGVQDKRGRFREIYCAVLAGAGRRGSRLPSLRRRADAARRRAGGDGPAGAARRVEPPSGRRGGAGHRLRLLRAVAAAAPARLTRTCASIGYDLRAIKVDALSGSANNARQIRDAIMAMDLGAGAPRLVLIGYSKGAPDVLEAIVNYPEIRASRGGGGQRGRRGRRLAAGQRRRAVPGRPAAPLSRARPATPATAAAWPACAPACAGPGWRRTRCRASVPTYSVVTLPQPERISSILRTSADKLSMIDGRNDSQMIFYDQVIPGSTLIGYVNADHWAIAVPIARAHDTIGSLFVTAERLSARGADGSGAAFRRRGSCRARASSCPDPPDVPRGLTSSSCARHRSIALARSMMATSTRCGAGRRGLAGHRPPAHAWVYPEHRDIAVLAVEKLDAERRALFDRLWGEARAGNEQRLCAQGADSQQGVAPACIDWAAFAGDRRRPFVLEQGHARHRRSRPTGSSRSPTWRRS